MKNFIFSICLFVFFLFSQPVSGGELFGDMTCPVPTVTGEIKNATFQLSGSPPPLEAKIISVEGNFEVYGNYPTIVTLSAQDTVYFVDSGNFNTADFNKQSPEIEFSVTMFYSGNIIEPEPSGGTPGNCSIRIEWKSTPKNNNKNIIPVYNLLLLQ